MRTSTPILLVLLARLVDPSSVDEARAQPPPDASATTRPAGSDPTPPHGDASSTHHPQPASDATPRPAGPAPAASTPPGGAPDDAPAPPPGADSAPVDAPTPAASTPADAPAGLRCLVAAYPDHLSHAARDDEGRWWLHWRGGARMPWDDGVDGKDLDARLRQPDLDDQMATPYPLGPPTPPDVDEDPGRVRFEPFFREMYGDSRRAVAARTARVRWLSGQRLRVTTVNQVDVRLRAVIDDLRRLPDEVTAIVTQSSGTFAWRTIRGTDRRSLHSFAVAVDVGVEHANYWRWDRPDSDGRLRYRNRIPHEVVEVFERHGFIWGGRWYHYDTMHFEYRPELLHPDCVGPRR